MSHSPPVSTPPLIAFTDGHRDVDALTLERWTRSTQDWLSPIRPRVVATLLDNGAAFVVLDDALERAGIVHVPLPTFFTPQQLQHALAATGVDLLIAEPGLAARWQGLPWQSATIADVQVATARLPDGSARSPSFPAGTAKITFTSGTTGAPKGVCLSAAGLQAVAGGLVAALAPLDIRRHLNVLPFAVLLENVAGLLAPRLQGATLITPPLAELGLSGSSGFDVARFDATVRRHAPHSLILLPQMLRAWTAWLQARAERAPNSLRLVAVGGAPVGATLIEAARALGIPACEGYGLSEGASVQTLDLPGATRPGSVGRALPHAHLRRSPEGELEIAGSLFLGYLGDDTPVPDWWPTGDLGHIDADGFVHIDGRRKHVLITGWGRNVSPEWVETALCSQPAILQAVVFGDGEPVLGAVLWPSRPDLPDSALQAAVDASNAGLPDYARIGPWRRGAEAFDVSTGLATANGRPQRAAILAAHPTLFGDVSSSPAPLLSL